MELEFSTWTSRYNNFKFLGTAKKAMSSQEVTSVNFNLSRISWRGTTALVTLFSSIPHHVKGLVLTSCALGAKDRKLSLQAIFTAFPRHLEALDLSENALDEYSDLDQLFNAFAALPRQLKSFSLAGNRLGKENDRLSGLLNAIRNFLSVQSLDLSMNHLNEIPLESLKAWPKLLQIETLYVSYHEILSMTKQQRVALRKAFATHLNIILFEEKEGKKYAHTSPQLIQELFEPEMNKDTTYLKASHARFFKERKVPANTLVEAHNEITKGC